MIDASELRIGNWVQFKGKEYQVSAHDIKELADNPEGVFPILLEEGWLESLGFEIINPFDPQEAFNRDATKFPVDLVKNVNGFWVLNNMEKGFCVCKYVHQLQNLYFALTHNELKIK